jgi:hypothetical protein
MAFRDESLWITDVLHDIVGDTKVRSLVAKRKGRVLGRQTPKLVQKWIAARSGVDVNSDHLPALAL